MPVRRSTKYRYWNTAAVFRWLGSNVQVPLTEARGKAGARSASLHAWPSCGQGTHAALAGGRMRIAEPEKADRVICPQRRVQQTLVKAQATGDVIYSHYRRWHRSIRYLHVIFYAAHITGSKPTAPVCRNTGIFHETSWSSWNRLEGTHTLY
jgi:hypothetical protein